MSAADSAFSPVKAWRWLWSMGLAIPLLIGAVLVLLVAITLVSNLYEAPTEAHVGSPDDFTLNQPKFFEEENFWLVKLSGDEVIALYDRDPYTGCNLTWGAGHEHMGRTGWLVDPCAASVYDVTGACFGGPCEVGLNRLDVRIEDGEIIVNPNDGTHGPIRSENGEPVNPPQ